MSNFCPFMSINPSVTSPMMTENYSVSCMDTCALYINGDCAFKIIAQKSMSDFETEIKYSSK